MAQQINATMSTSVALDLLQASESVKNLTSVVRSSQSAWKAQEAEMKSAGDIAGAAQAKYEGLGKSIEAQQAKIDALKSKQSELKGNTSETAAQFLKYQQQIDGATKQLASMQAQQDRAKQAMDYQKSGLAGLQSEYAAAARANKVYVERLQAEGKEQEANKAKMDGYKSAIGNLNEQLAKQSAELDKIANASGKDSDAWRTQKTRVDETATALAKAKSSMTGLQTEMNKANPSIFERIKEHITGTKDEADKSTLSFKKMVSATAIGQKISDAWTQFSGTIKTTITQGVQLAEAGEQAERVWKELGVGNKGAEQLVGQMRDLKSETNMSADQVSTLQKRFYGMTGSVDTTKDLTLGVATLGDKLRLSGDGTATFAKSLQRAFNNGKLTTGVLTRMENAAPGLGSALAKASGVSETAFNSMVAGGQITSKKLQDLIVKISKDSKSTFNDFGNTSEGASQRLKGAWQGVEATLAKPLVSVQSTGISSIVNVLKASAVTSLFTSLGKAIAGAAKQAANLLNYIAAHQKDIGGIITSVGTIVKIFGAAIWSSISGVAKSIAKSFGLISDNAKKSTDPLKQANSAFAGLAKHKTVISGIAKGLLAVYAAVKLVTTAQKALNFVENMSTPIKVTAIIVAIGTALYELYKHNKKFRDFVNGIIKGVQDMVKGIAKWIGTVVKDWNGMWSSVGKGWNTFLKTMSSWGKAISSMWNKIWTPITKAMSALWKGLANIAKAGLNALKLAIVVPIALIVGLAIKAWEKIEKPFKAVWNALVKLLSPILKAISTGISNNVKAIQKTWSTSWNAVSKTFSNVWNNISKIGSNVEKTVANGITSMLNGIKKTWNNSWNAISKLFSDVWNGMVKTLSPIIKAIQSLISNTINSISKTWDTVWNTISKLFSDIWTGMQKAFTPIIHGISNTIGSVIKDIKSVWHDVWSDVGSFFSHIWDGIKKSAQDGINFVIGILRSGLGAVNDVLGFFGVKKISLPSYVHFAQGGEVGKNGTQLAMVNDDAEHNKELIHKRRTNEWLYAEKPNTILPLETGDRIYNGKESKAIAKMYGIPGFAGGGIIGSVWDGIKSATSYVTDKASDVASWIGDKVTALTDWIAHPIQKVTSVIQKAIAGLVKSSPLQWIGQMSEGIFNHVMSGIASWIKKQLKKIQDSTDLGGGAKKSYPELEAIARQAASIMGVSPSADFIKALANVAMSESGGNAGAANLTDSNARAGMASVGLLQYIPSTWAYYNVPGHNNRSSVLDNFIHFFNNSDWKNSIGYVTYPSWGGMYKWDWRNNGPQGAPRMANGGIVNRPISAIVGEDGPESVIPLGAAKASRAWQLLGQAVHVINNGQQPVEQGGDAEVSGKLDVLHSDLANLTQAIQQMVVVSVLNPDDAAKALNEPLTKIQSATIKINKTLSRSSYGNGGATVIG